MLQDGAAVLVDNQVAAACSRSVVLNNISCPIVWAKCSVVIIYAIIVLQDGAMVLVGNQVAAASRRSVVLNNISCPIVWARCPVVIIYAIIVR